MCIRDIGEPWHDIVPMHQLVRFYFYARAPKFRCLLVTLCDDCLEDK